MLGSPVWALPSVILAGNWTFFGFCMTIFLAGLQNIDKNLFEAAIIDGANRIQSFRYITIPSLRNQINLLIIYILIGSFKVFDIVYVMTKGVHLIQPKLLEPICIQEHLSIVCQDAK